MRTILLALAMLIPFVSVSYEHRGEVDPALFAKPGIRFEETLK